MMNLSIITNTGDNGTCLIKTSQSHKIFNLYCDSIINVDDYKKYLFDDDLMLFDILQSAQPDLEVISTALEIPDPQRRNQHRTIVHKHHGAGHPRQTPAEIQADIHQGLYSKTRETESLR